MNAHRTFHGEALQVVPKGMLMRVWWSARYVGSSWVRDVSPITRLGLE